MVKRLGLIGVMFFSILNSFGQPLTKEEGFRYAELLYANNILNQDGMVELKMLIEKNKLTFDPHFGLTPCGKTETSKASILQFCYHSFLRESFYRREMKFRPSIPFTRKSTKKDYIRLGNHLEQGVSGTDTVLDHIIQIPWSFPFNYKIRSFIHPSKSILGKTRLQTAKELLYTGLIDSTIFLRIKNALDIPSIGLETSVCKFASWESKFRERYPARKKDQLIFLDSLERVGIIDKRNKDFLILSYQPYRFLDAVDVLAQCRRSIIFNGRRSDDPATIYTKLFSQINEIIPEFSFDKMSFDLDTVFSTGYVAVYATIVLDANQKSFPHRFLYKDASDITGLEYPRRNPIRQSYFYEVLNIWLEDSGFDERFHVFTGRDPDINSDQSAIILLNARQANTWNNGAYFPSNDKL